MSTFLKTYDPAEVIIQVDGTDMVGFPDGDMVTVERNEDIFTPMVGTKGEVSRAYNRNCTGSATIRLQHVSPSVEFLDTILFAEDQDNNIPKIVLFTIVDPASGEEIVSTQGWVTTQPTRSWGNEVGVREYNIFLVNAFFIPASL